MSDPEAGLSAQDQQARRLDQIAQEAELMAEHARIAALHFRNREIPRGAAHTLALTGHSAKVRSLLDEIAIAHAERAQTTV
ncbi:MAG: hypothetical protein JF588_13330 [Caulobacterales bacterium]|nr:hypothetical protein [Caulobacterales bacterium]